MKPAPPQQPLDPQIEIANLKALLEQKDTEIVDLKAVIKTLESKLQSWKNASDPDGKLKKRITPSMPPGTSPN